MEGVGYSYPFISLLIKRWDLAIGKPIEKLFVLNKKAYLCFTVLSSLTAMFVINELRFEYVITLLPNVYSLFQL
jgi:hypothetical protein